MVIAVGTKVPDVALTLATADGPKPTTTTELLSGKTVALFAVPGAFTPTCSAKHLPGFKDNAAALKAAGVDTIACVSVNDAFVMNAWAKDQGITNEVVMLADGNAALTDALGLSLDATGFGMGKRSQRYAMLIKDGVVKILNVEEGGAFAVSSAEHLLGQLQSVSA